LTILICLFAAPALAQDAAWDIAGRGDRLWLLEVGPNTWDVFTRKAGGDWKALSDGFSGGAIFAVAGPDRLEVFFADRQMATIGPSGELTPGPRLPAAPLAACYQPGADGQAPRLLVLTRPSAEAGISGKPEDSDAPETSDASKREQANTGPDTESPAEPDASAEATPAETEPPARQPEDAPPASTHRPLHLYRLVGNTWKKVGKTAPVEIQPDLTGGPTGLSLAATADRICIGLAGSDGHHGRMLRYNAAEQKWLEPVDIPGAEAILTNVDDRIVAVVRATADEESDARILNLHTWDIAATSWGEPQPLRENGTAKTWPASPQLAATGQQLVLLWQAEGKVMLASTALDGVLMPPESITDELQAVPDSTRAARIQQGFMIALLVLLVLASLACNSGRQRRVFQLPPVLIPGGLIRRAIAAGIDFTPFTMLAGLYLRLTHTEAQLMAVAENNDPTAVTPHMTIAIIIMFSAYVLYGTIAEGVFGMTVGKRLMRLRVTGNGGLTPNLRTAFLRNLMKVFEALPLMAGTAWLFAIFAFLTFITRYKQRPGDIFARTAVIESRALRLPSGAVMRTDQDVLAKLPDVVKADGSDDTADIIPEKVRSTDEAPPAETPEPDRRADDEQATDTPSAEETEKDERNGDGR
jgi:uncharacterized RDD family membrane protein YckC